MNSILCKAWAYVKYYFLKANMKYDGTKEPWRFLIALLLVTPWMFTMDSKIGSTGKILGICWMLALVLMRMCWHFWVKVRMEEKKDE